MPYHTDIVAGAISNAVTLNRFAYANGNPVSLVDPFGLMANRVTQICMSHFGIFLKGALCNNTVFRSNNGSRYT